MLYDMAKRIIYVSISSLDFNGILERRRCLKEYKCNCVFLTSKWYLMWYFKHNLCNLTLHST